MMEGVRLDFAAINAAALDAADRLVPAWLPGGRREGHEFKAGGLGGEAGRSLSVNLGTGVWADFATDDKGSDLISLYAAVYGLSQVDAARQLASELHVGLSAAPAPSAPVPERRRSEWTAIVPVPDVAGQPPRSHARFGKASHVWCYRRDGQVFGYVRRFDRINSKGQAVKEVLPLTWCRNDVDGSMKWHDRQWDVPRPLYLPAGTLHADRPAVVVEGEKCADALHRLLGDEFDVVAWPGGANATEKADWSWLAGRKVLLWADTDSKRQKVPRGEEGATAPESMPFLPLHKQPGVRAMVSVGIFLDAQGCDVYMLPVAQPGELPDGYDVADMIAGGASASQVRERLREGRREVLQRLCGMPAPEAAHTPGSAGAAHGDDAAHDWRMRLLRNEKGGIKACRENIVLALTHIPEVAGLIARNVFANRIEALQDLPWGQPAGPWPETGELQMGAWLVHEHGMPPCARNVLEEALQMAADQHQYHPVRVWLTGLKWDGTPRLPQWLARVCSDDPAQLSYKTAVYYSLVGQWFLMGMAQRVLVPGCKFDYMPILEGAQGMRKSTLVAALGSIWSADTNLQLGDKDSYQNLQGVWIYEFSELDSMGKAEITRVKAFVASRTDRFRASFDRRPNDYPRQVVFMGTTNETQYLTDHTGNRRFWPVHVTRQIDTDWLLAHREQLFAEAVVRLQRGESFFPTPQQEREIFLPQQTERMIESPVESAIIKYLTSDATGMLLQEVQLVTLLGSIGVDLSKLGPGRHFEKQAGAALRKFGWTRQRSSKPGRPWVYRRPDGWPACMRVEDVEETIPDPIAPDVDVDADDGFGSDSQECQF